MKSVQTRAVYRCAQWSACAVVLALLSGCSAPVLGALASAATASSQAALLEERAEQQALASTTAVPEKSPQIETQASYLQVVAEMQRKQLWFASLAHLDVIEAKWKRSDDSTLLRADAMRHVGIQAESAQLYTQLLQGGKAAQARHGLGLLAAQAGRYGDAAAQLEAARKAAPTDALLLNDLGYALLHTAQALSARIPLMQAAQLAPQNPRIQANVALFLLLHGEGAQATEWMNQHQMGESLRLQVFAQAQRIATAAVQEPPAAKAVDADIQQPVTPAVVKGAEPMGAVASMPAPAAVAALAAQPSAMWMTERNAQGARP